MANSNLHEPARRGWIVGIAIAMVPCIALAAVFVPNFGFSILYAIPLTLLGCCGQLRAMRWLTLAAIALAFVTYFLKFWLDPPTSGPQFLSFRIVNRAIMAGMLWLLSKVLGMWYEAERYRQDPLWSDEFDRAHGQISAMLGMLIAMPTVVCIALVDALTPGQFNFAVLYVVPLVTCAWVRSVRLLWTLCALLVVLTIGGLFWGPPPAAEEPFQRFFQNRVFQGSVMILVAGLMHYWIRATGKVDQNRLLQTPTEADSPRNDDDRVVTR
ncbi:MAG TPA: hypothetical protein VHY91_15435 [Pirellulales bacterium]|jgi:hypothetical protein|nr:hypothetical protein [Pirellulales bacterium]